MDYKRIALIAGLAIVSYLLLLEWNRDYPAQSPATSQETVTQSQPDDGSGGDLPTAETAPAATDEDIPEVSSQEGSEALTPASSPESLITVSTPVQNVTIDLNGGDIVELTLPKFPTSLETPDDPFVLLNNEPGRVYVAQSGLIGRNGIDSNGRARYSTSASSYSLDPGEDSLSVDLRLTTDQGVEVTKRYTFSPDDYLIEIEYIINNETNEPWRANLFGQIKRGGFEDPSSSGGFGMSNYLGAVLTLNDDPYVREDFGDIDSSASEYQVDGGWIGFSQHYFLGAWIPEQNQTHTLSTRKNSSGQYLMGFVSPVTVVAPGSSETVSTGFWAGPKDQYRLEEIAENLNLTIDYGWLWFIAQPIFWLLTQLNDLIGNFGWSIIAMTIVIKLIFFKLSATSYRSMARMRKLAPKVQQLKDRHGDDKQKLMQAQMELWKKEKVNPMGGCLPMLVQMPVLIGIYWVLMESVELRHAEWMLWYNDLSAMDPYFVLPLIMGASMYVSQLMTPMMTMDPMQAKMMRLMPLFFTIFFLWFPAGLVLYWLVSNIFNIVQQWYINKKVDEAYQAKTT